MSTIEVTDLGFEVYVVEGDPNTVLVYDVGLQGAPGDDAPSDHTLLSNIGTNTHAQIDTHIANTSNPHNVTKSQVGLGNVDNTSDLDKPVSNATATEIQAIHNGLITQTAILSINGGDSSKFDVAAGEAIINGSYVSWSASAANTVTNLATATRTYVFIDSNGSILQSTTAPTAQTIRTRLYLGQLGHTNNTTVNSASNTPSVWKNPDDQLRDLLRALGVYSVSGNNVSYNGTNLNINISSGELMASGINWENDENSPNIKTYSQLIAPTFRHRTQTGAGASSSILDVANYDNAGTITSIGGGANTSQNFRVYRLVTGNIVIQYGQHTYSSLDDAIAAIDTESFVEFSNLSEVGCLIGIISVKKTATDLSNSAQARFFNAVRLGASTIVNDLSNYLTLAEAASTVNGEGASLIGVEDSGGLYSSTTVEDALAEVKTLSDAAITALTGDVTTSGSGSVAATIANNAVTYAKIQNVSATDKLLGRSSSGAGDIEEITCTAAGRALLDDADAAAQITTLGLDNTKIAAIGITIDGGGSAITTGSKGYVYVPYACTINSATLLADQSGSIVIDIKKSTYADFPTTASIAASAKPTLSSAQKSTDSTLTGWTTSVAAGDCIEFVVDSITTVTRVHLSMKVTKT